MPVLDKSNSAAVEKYLEFVRSHTNRTLTQDPDWSEVKWDWGSEQVYLEEDGQIIAAMSLLVKKVPFFGALLYAPRGPVAENADPVLVRKIVIEAQPLVKKYKAFALKFDPETPYSSELEKEYEQAGFVVRNKGAKKDALIQPRYNMVLHFEDHDQESIMQKFSGKIRNRIRSAAKKGVYAEHGRSDQFLETFYEIYLEMSERNRLTPRSYEYFLKMREAFPGLRVYLAKHEEDTLSAGVTINYYGKLYYLYAGSRDKKRNLGPNQFLNYEMIRWGIEEGAEQYDFGGVIAPDKSDGLYEFKIGFCHKDGMTEYIGEIDQVYKKFSYYAFTHLVPKIQRLRIILTRK